MLILLIAGAIMSLLTPRFLEKWWAASGLW